MSVDIRVVEAGEHEAWLDQLGRAFFMQHTAGASDYYLSISDPGRSRGAFDGAVVVGTLRSFADELTVPGPSTVRASALTAVSVAPTHRRRGVLTRMIVPDLQDSKDRGEVVSVLLASEYPIYGRFGYGPATEQGTYEVTTPELEFTSPSEGSVELVSLPEMRTLAPPVFERFRTSQHGSIGRRDAWWDRSLRQVAVPGDEPRKGFPAVYRATSGDVEGYVHYRGELGWEQFPPRGKLTIEEMVATTPAAYQALWAFCAAVDLTTTVVAPNRAADEVLPLLVNDGRKVRQTERYDFLWVRILDTASALASRTYSSEDRLIVEVRDELSLAAGTFELEGSPEGASCTATTAAPDLSVSVRALGSAYLGGASWSRLADAGLLDEHRLGAVARADRMFRTARAPWCTTHF